MLLCGMQVMTDDLAAAVATLQQALAVYRDLGDRAGQADAINSLGFVYELTGQYPMPPPPATSRRWGYSAISVTGAAKPTPSTDWASSTR